MVNAPKQYCSEYVRSVHVGAMRVGLPFFAGDVVFMFVHMKNHVIKMAFNLFVCAYNSGTKTVNDQTYKYILNLNHTAHIHPRTIQNSRCEKKKWCARLTHVLIFNYWLLTCLYNCVCLSNWRRSTEKPPTKIVCAVTEKRETRNGKQKKRKRWKRWCLAMDHSHISVK